jgi:hypothetical protein
LVAAGIVEGYPDGEYKGQQSMTRYEMAVMVSRALDNIAAEQEAMAEGLTTGQAEDVTAIVESLMAKNSNDTLSDGQAEEVADIVDALTFELKAELKVLGADLEALGKDVDALEAKVDAMDVPEDNIEFAMDVTTVFEVAEYGATEAEQWAAYDLLQDGDAVDESIVADPDLFASEKAFYQEYDFNIAGSLGDAEFNLAVDTISNVFTEEDRSIVYENNNLYSETDSDDFLMDSALLEVNYADSYFAFGDFGDYMIEPYFNDEEDREGMEMMTSYMGNDIHAFVMGSDSDTDKTVDEADDEEYYGVTVARDMDFGTVTGKVYHARDVASLGGNSTSKNEVTNVAVQVEDVVLTDAVSMGAEVVFNDWEDETNNTDENDTLFNVNAEFAATDALTIDGMIEVVGEDYRAPYDDLEDHYDYDLFKVGMEYVLDENNTLTGAYTMVQVGDLRKSEIENGTDVEDDQSTLDLGLENVYGKFTNNVSVQYVQNEDNVEDYEETEFNVGTEYAWSETLSIGANLTYNVEEKAAGDLLDYTYLTAFADKKLAENVSWNTEAFVINGTVGAQYNTVYDGTNHDTYTLDRDGEATGLTTSLSVSF